METSTVSDPDTYTNSSSTSNNSRRNGFQFSTLSFLRAPVSTLLEYSGVLRPRRDHHEAENLIVDGRDEQFHRRSSDFGSESGSGEVSIRIIGAGEQENVGFEESEEAIGQISGGAGPRLGDEGGDGGEVGGGERASSGASPSATDAGNGDGGGGNGGRDSSYQRYDIQQVARWVEQVLPFSLLLLVVFIRQHLQESLLVWVFARLDLSFGMDMQQCSSIYNFVNVSLCLNIVVLSVSSTRLVSISSKAFLNYEILATRVERRVRLLVVESLLGWYLFSEQKWLSMEGNWRIKTSLRRENLEKVLLVIGTGWIELRCPFKCDVTEVLQSFPGGFLAQYWDTNDWLEIWTMRFVVKYDFKRNLMLSLCPPNIGFYLRQGYFKIGGFFVTIWITAVMFKSNDILRKQTALKGERKISVLVGISTVFMLQVIGVYWWYRNDDLLYPLFLIPPKAVPPFWHAIFIILVNDTLVRQAAMALKCMLLMYYKNGRGNNFRRQGQILTLIEYTLLLYRALLPTPVWYRFFLNKEYGGLFSSLTTGLYLTFKLTSVVEKVQSFFASLKALSQKDIHYGSYATLEQVNAAGDLCAICQEKMHAPILLRCKHIFCEDCVSEWFERERTCPLCRALVKAADLRSFGDGSTSLFFQLF
ncbi:RING/U-box superfamily protein [Actinidia rufa]|uniref:RING/U-box superfamily protein n=1 Tax=Actinidia rufa TaxID=165716 RepID=A0A7J0EAR2_9ERIC|nr:RING/U-box superfamily protein [Actinidia rufa]